MADRLCLRLGLTNYQVLLLAALPLVVVIFLRDIALFRDFIMVGIPILLSAHVLQIGAMMPAQPGMAGPAYAKVTPGVAGTVAVPSMTLLVAGAVCVFLGLAVALILKNCKNGGVVKRHLAFLSGVAPHGGAIGAGITAFGALLVFFSMGAAKTGVAAATDLPLFASSVYTSVAGLIVLVIAFCIGGAYAYRDKLNDKAVLTWLVPACAMLLILFSGSLPSRVRRCRMVCRTAVQLDAADGGAARRPGGALPAGLDCAARPLLRKSRGGGAALCLCAVAQGRHERSDASDLLVVLVGRALGLRHYRTGVADAAERAQCGVDHALRRVGRVVLHLHADCLGPAQSADELGLSAHMGRIQARHYARSV